MKKCITYIIAITVAALLTISCESVSIDSMEIDPLSDNIQVYYREFYDEIETEMPVIDVEFAKDGSIYFLCGYVNSYKVYRSSSFPLEPEYLSPVGLIDELSGHYSSAQFDDIEITYDGQTLYVCGDVIMRSRDAGASWEKTSMPDDDFFNFDKMAISNDGAIYISDSFHDSKVHYSINSGNSWDTLDLTINAEYSKIINSNGTIYLLNTYEGNQLVVYKNTDGPCLWEEIKSFTADAKIDENYMRNNINIFTAEDGSLIINEFSKDNRAYKKLKANDEWIKLNSISTSTTTSDWLNNYMAFTNRNGLELIAWYGNSISRSKDLGASWTDELAIPFGNNKGFLAEDGHLYLYGAETMNDNGKYFMLKTKTKY